MDAPKRKPAKRDLALVELNVKALAVMLSIFAAPFIAGCVFFVLKGAHEADTQHRLNTRADRVDAVITSTRVGQQTVGDSKTGRSVSYRPVVEFTYEVDGVSYSSDSVWASGESRSERSWADAVIRRYPVGGTVRAYVDPENAARAFLEVRWGSGAYISMLMGSGMLSAIWAAGIWLLGWSRVRGALVFCAAAVAGGIAITGWASWLWEMQVPEEVRAGWWLFAGAGTVVLAFLPMLAIPSARARSKRYVRAKAWVDVHGLDDDSGAGGAKG